MCACDDADYPTFYDRTKPVARKVHKCDECGREIQPGHTYERVAGKWDGEVGTFKTCEGCVILRDHVIEEEGGGCFPPHGMLLECARDSARETLIEAGTLSDSWAEW